MITLITMAQGNPVALKRTLDSFKGLCNEVVFGDLLVFPTDRAVIESYGVKMVALPFNFIFKNGFAATLNELAKYATNDWVLYMNCSEVLESGDIVITNANANCYCFDHATDPHKWYRLYNRQELQWAGIIHEELVGRRRPQPEPIFRMADTPKDDYNPFHAWVCSDLKEAVYFKQYLRLVDEPGIIGITNHGWVEYAKRDYSYIKERLEAKGKRLTAIENNDLDAYLAAAIEDYKTSNGFESNHLIHF